MSSHKKQQAAKRVSEDQTESPAKAIKCPHPESEDCKIAMNNLHTSHDMK